MLLIFAISASFLRVVGASGPFLQSAPPSSVGSILFSDPSLTVAKMRWQPNPASTYVLLASRAGMHTCSVMKMSDVFWAEKA
jgi:hypothetical protein